jgi:hypothetical protein
MLISGFTMVKNADKLYYPIKQAIESILPIVDEFVVALGDCDEGDKTEELIKSIDSDKVRIVHTVWDIKKYPNGMENAHQTDIAKSHCKGTWCFYLQADEVVHEKYLPVIKARCEQLANDSEVEALLFNYVHFWGDYKHYQHAHGWYKKEIRIVKNHPDIHSWVSAQSFRRIPNFDGLNYRVKEGTFKLKAAQVDAQIYHYGWVRPPKYMQKKKKSLDTIHKGTDKVNSMYNLLPGEYDYGPLGRASEFKETHPAVMKEWIEDFHWADKLNYTRKERNPDREKNKHDRPKYRFITFLEQYVFGGRELFGTKNYEFVKR